MGTQTMHNLAECREVTSTNSNSWDRMVDMDNHMMSSKDNITAITIIITVETTIKEVTIRIVAVGIEEDTTITIIIILITIISFRASTILRVMQDMLGMLD